MESRNKARETLRLFRVMDKNRISAHMAKKEKIQNNNLILVCLYVHNSQAGIRTAQVKTKQPFGNVELTILICCKKRLKF
jgi:hypothetical protein